MQTEDAVIFVEFKNGKVEARDVKTKVRDSLLMYCDITKTTISDTRNDAVFILVYSLERNTPPKQLTRDKPAWKSQVYISSYLAEKGKTKLIRFDLERFEGLYFREVYTYTKEEFDRFLQTLP